MINKFLDKAGVKNKNSIATQSILVMLMNFSGSAFYFAITIILPRILGKAGYGSYTYAFTWVELLGLLALFGFDKVLVREVAKYNAKGEHGKIKGTMIYSGIFILFSSVFFGLIALAISFSDLKAFDDPVTRTCFQIALICAPIHALGLHRTATLIGIKQVVLGQFPDKFLRGVVMLCLFATTYLTMGKFDPVTAVLLNIAGYSVAFITGSYFLVKKTKDFPLEKLESPEKRKLIGMGSTMMLLSVLMIVSAKLDIFMLGELGTREDIGAYSVAFKLSNILLFFLGSFNTVFAPRIAEHYAKGEMKKLQSVGVQSARLFTLITVTGFILLFIFRDMILGIYGENNEFLVARDALMYLGAGFIFAVATGSVGNILIMSGFVGYSNIALIIGIVLNTTLNIILFPKYGIDGAAVATMGSTILINLLQLLFVYIKLGINPSILGSRK